MRIAVNTRLLLKDKLEGIGWFTYQVLERLVKWHPQHEFLFLFDRPYDAQFLFGENVKAVVLGPQARHPLLYYLWYDWSIPHLLKKYKADVFLSTDGILPLHTKVPMCLVMHDLAFENYPEHLDRAHRLFYKKLSPKFAQRAAQLVTVSHFSKEDMVKRYGIAEEKISVACNGAHDLYRVLNEEEKRAVREKYSQGVPYFYFAGALHPRKNVANLLKAFIVFKRKFKSNMKLVIVGRMAWNYQQLVEMKEDMPFKEDVVWTGYQSVEKLSDIAGAAYALVYPSLFEGFGIPILEALKCEVPVIVSNTSSMPEVAGPAGLLVNPTDHRDIAEKMGMLYKDEDLRASLVQKGKQHILPFTWDHAATVVWEALMKAADKIPRAHG